MSVRDLGHHTAEVIASITFGTRFAMRATAQAGRAQFDQAFTGFDRPDEFVNERLEPIDERGSPGVSNPDPNHDGSDQGGCLARREIFVLTDDHRAVLERVVPQPFVRRVAGTDVNGVLRLVPESDQPPCKAGGSWASTRKRTRQRVISTA